MKNYPKVSVLLPNLNNYSYLEERLHTILAQTLSNWELIIVDSYSEDGAWELFQAYAQTDLRIQIRQAPREGIFAGWNECIKLAKGEYVYIATSDDTMEATCLEKMVEVLDRHPECDLAHCCLKVIDSAGNPSDLFNWDDFIPFFSGLIEVKQANIRYAPYDGLVHCAEGGVYTSITQLLIRRTLFEKIGLFLTDVGSVADFEWAMRASLLANTYHIPEYLATWRIHSSQATSFEYLQSIEHNKKVCELIDHAFKVCSKIDPGKLKGIHVNKFRYARQRRVFDYEWSQSRSKTKKIVLLIKWLKINPYLIKSFIEKPEKKFNPVDFIKNQIVRANLEEHVQLQNA